MEYVARLLRDQEYQNLIRELEELERERSYCRHGFEHLMDVARLGYLYALEEGMTLDKEQFYLSALLHDIGRVEEYKYGIPHEEAGCRKSEEILLRIGYPKEQIQKVQQVIMGHRGGVEVEETSMSELLRRADKTSRACFFCRAADSCKWSEERRNRPENWM